MSSKRDKAAKRSPTAPFKRVGENLYRLASSGGYYALLKRGGKQFRRSLKTHDRKLAERRLAELKRDVERLTLSGDGSLSFTEVAHSWLQTVKHGLKPASIKRREGCIHGLSPFFKSVNIRNVLRKHCDDWVSKRGNQISASSFVQELDTLKLILDHAVDQGLLLTNHAAKIKRRKVVNKDIQVPTRDQFKEIINCMRDEGNEFGTQGKSKDGADLIELLAYSGCRLNEAVELKWKQVDFEAGSIKVDGGEAGTKNHEFRKVPMSEALRKHLCQMKGKAKTFPEGSVIAIGDAKRSLKRACRVLGFTEFTHHDFRHFFATTCIESNVDIATISRWLGHKDGGALAMKVYGHLRDEHSQKMIQQVKF